MKAYQIWEDNYCSRTDTECPSGSGCGSCTSKRKEGWRAALEWAYKQETDPQATEIGDAILRELGEE